MSVAGKADVQIDGAMNLILFDDRAGDLARYRGGGRDREVGGPAYFTAATFPIALLSDRPFRRMSDQRSPTSATRAAIVRSVNVCGPTSPRSISSHVHGADTGAPGFGAHGVGGGERRAVAVAAGVDEDAAAAIGLAELLRQMLRIALRRARVPTRVRERRDLADSRPCRRAARRCGSPWSRTS